MIPLTGVTVWALAIGFLGGLGGGDALGPLFTALGAFIQGCTNPRAPWRWAIQTLAAWAAGTGVGILLTVVEGGHAFEAPSQLSAGLTVVAAYASAGVGAALAWVSSRLAREG